MSRKTTSLFFFFGLLVSVTFMFLSGNNFGVCGVIYTETDYYPVCDFIAELTLLFIPIFFFSFLIKRDIVFKFWKKFTFIYSFIYSFIYLSRPTDGDFLDPAKDDTAWFLSILYSIISSLLIVYKIWEQKSIEKNKNVSSFLLKHQWFVIILCSIISISAFVVIINFI